MPSENRHSAPGAQKQYAITSLLQSEHHVSGNKNKMPCLIQYQRVTQDLLVVYVVTHTVDGNCAVMSYTPSIQT